MASQDFSSSLPGEGLPKWQEAYESALQESDKRALFKRIEVAEAAILTRRADLAQSQNGFAEREEMNKALTKLRSLKKNILKF